MAPRVISDTASKLQLLQILTSSEMKTEKAALEMHETRRGYSCFLSNFLGKRRPTMAKDSSRKQARYVKDHCENDELTETSSTSDESSASKEETHQEEDMVKPECTALRKADPFLFYANSENRLKYYMFEDVGDDEYEFDESDCRAATLPASAVGRIEKCPLKIPACTSTMPSRRLSTEAHQSMHFMHMFEQECKI